jgi:PAS domain S-box-containing protein
MSREPPRCWPLAATGVHIDVPPSVQRFIIRTVAAKEVHRPELPWSQRRPKCDRPRLDWQRMTPVDNNQVVDRRRTAQASQSPREALEQLPALVLLERIPVPTLAVLQDGTIVFANKAFAEMVGREAEEVVVLKFHDFFHTALETESVLSVVDGLANMVVELAHKDGSTVRALMSRSALRRADEKIALATFQDLTEHLWVNER